MHGIKFEMTKSIFISGRFRSGTTILWNIFRLSGLVRTYYEPLHDNLIDYINAEACADPTHRGVKEYFREYRDIMDGLKVLHKPTFGVSRLCLGSKESFPELKEYLDFLASAAVGTIPLFKFVRADFRLPWLRSNYP